MILCPNIEVCAGSFLSSINMNDFGILMGSSICLICFLWMTVERIAPWNIWPWTKLAMCCIQQFNLHSVLCYGSMSTRSPPKWHNYYLCLNMRGHYSWIHLCSVLTSSVNFNWNHSIAISARTMACVLLSIQRRMNACGIVFNTLLCTASQQHWIFVHQHWYKQCYGAVDTFIILHLVELFW